MRWVIGACFFRCVMEADRRAIAARRLGERPRAQSKNMENPLNRKSSSNGDSLIVEAELQVGVETVRYRRAGTGAPVLLLQVRRPGPAGMGKGIETDEDNAVGEDIAGDTFAALARGHRVFQPTTPIPRSRDHAERWLRGVVEGLGLVMPDVVADPELAPALARLVRQKGGFVGQVTFLAGTEPGG